ncbi:MAG: hypothetical protein MUC33_24200, partial [Desulfobacterales bacterium]|nr:hypothetical protein [Desulfobacterales bacterium]
MKTYPLRVFVKRVLLIRLGTATLALALITGAITYFVQQGRIEQQVADNGRQGINVLTHRVMGIAEKVAYRAGRFVWVQFYDRSGAVVAEVSVPEFQAVAAKALAEKRPFAFPEPAQAEADMQRIGGRPFVFAAMPIADRQGAVKGYARGAFAVSPESAAEMRSAV